MTIDTHQRPGAGKWCVLKEHLQWCLDNATKLERILDQAGFPPAKPLPPLTY